MELFLVWFCGFLALGLLGFICLARRDLGGTIPGLVLCVPGIRTFGIYMPG